MDRAELESFINDLMSKDETETNVFANGLGSIKDVALNSFDKIAELEKDVERLQAAAQELKAKNFDLLLKSGKDPEEKESDEEKSDEICIDDLFDSDGLFTGGIEK